MSLGSDDSDGKAVRVRELVEKIGPLLHGQGPEVQSAVLADLTAMWLAGHMLLDDVGEIDAAATERLRLELLTEHVRLVDNLIRPNEAAILARHGVRQPIPDGTPNRR